MKSKLKITILLALIIVVAVGIGFLLVNSVRSIAYNKNAKNPLVTLTIENYGDVQIELYPDYAPNTVATFIKLIQNGYYNGKVFYGTDGTAVDAGMTYAGDAATANNLYEAAESSNGPTERALKVSDLDKSKASSENTENTTDVANTVSNDTSSSTSNNTSENSDDYEISIDGEFAANDYEKNTLRFEKGTVGLYRTDYNGYGTDLSKDSYNSGKALFFILTKEDSNLNGMYAAFGKVVSGMDIINQINALPTKENEDDTSSSSTSENSINIKYFNDNYPVIKTATVETYGVDYGMPKYNKAFDYNSWLSNLLMRYYSSNSSSSSN